MDERPVTIRLLGPAAFTSSSLTPRRTSPRSPSSLGVSPEVVEDRNKRLKEANPMLGHRGCRLGITFPEIYEMQVRAINPRGRRGSRRRRAGEAGDHDPAGRVRGRDVFHEDTRQARRPKRSSRVTGWSYKVGTMKSSCRARAWSRTRSPRTRSSSRSGPTT